MTHSLIRLHTWLSPAFPTGAFAFSHGLEQAIADGQVRGADQLRDWIAGLLAIGSQWNDAVLFAESWRRAAAGEDIAGVAELAVALAGSSERLQESLAQGQAFVKAAQAWDMPEGVGSLGEIPLCVAAGGLCGAHGIALEDALAVWLNAFAINQTQAAIRLSVLGQTEASSVLASLEGLLQEIAEKAARSDLDHLGSAAFMADIAAMKHETLQPRLFLS